MTEATDIRTPERAASSVAKCDSLQRLVSAPLLRVEKGDCRDVLPTLDAMSAQCCVTSPPYWGLRDYGHPDQIGLEKTPEHYVCHLVEVFNEVWRVLKDDGTLWLNLGDSYAKGYTGRPDKIGKGKWVNDPKERTRSRKLPLGRRAHDLCGVPWLVALALQRAGWMIRSEITWCKKSPMPEKAQDRPTSATEKIFLLTKSDEYYYDGEAVRERDENGGNHKMWNYWHLPHEPIADCHYAPFPTTIAKRCIAAGTKPGDIVLDPFAGTGTVGKVALELGRSATLIEINGNETIINKRTHVTPGLPLAR